MNSPHMHWRKSSRSGWEGNCVEISSTSDCIFIRDSKNPTGNILACNQAEWSALLGTVKNGDLDLC